MRLQCVCIIAIFLFKERFKTLGGYCNSITGIIINSKLRWVISKMGVCVICSLSLNTDNYQSVWSSACASSSRLNSKDVVEDGADEVVVQESAGVRVVDEEREHGQSRNVQVSQNYQVLTALPVRLGFTGIK